MAAISTSKTLLPFNLPDQIPPPKKCTAVSFPIQKSHLHRTSSSVNSPTKPLKFLSRGMSVPLSSIFGELDKEKQPETETEEEDFERNKEEQNLLPDLWRKIHGEDDWAEMLDPMNPLLRSELLRYGEMAQACYDAFDFDPFSKYCGSCRYLHHQFFDSLGMNHHGYNISRYLFATSNVNLPNFFKKSRWPKVWSKNANWMGYVAVSDDETFRKLGRRDITIAWRGTVTRLEWITDLKVFLKSVSSNKIPCPDPTVKAESGFLDLYTDNDQSCRFCKFSARQQILSEVKRLMELFPNEKLSITISGHSLGAALAILSAYDIAETGLNVMKDGRAVPVSVFSFSGPRVGNVRFKERIEALGVKVLRVFNVHDIVPKSPGFLFNEQSPPVMMKLAEGLPSSYSHVGEELALDHKKSPFLKDTVDPVCTHNLEALLHLLDGYQGKGKKFALASKRDHALVNKGSDFLEDYYQVPPFWRQPENKGMVKNKEGRWMQVDRPRLDDHPEDIHHHLNELGILHPSSHN